MSSKTIRHAIMNTLEDLTQANFQKFCHHLLDRRQEPCVRRNRVEGKSFLDITDVLVSTFTETGAARVVREILGDIGCNEEARAFGETVCSLPCVAMLYSDCAVCQCK